MPRNDDEFDQVMFRIPPYQYLHVLDTNSNVTRNINGPITFTRQDHEKVVAGPSSMLTIPPRHYVIIANPAIMEDDVAVLDEHGLVKLRHGDFEVRLTKSPFPLYPGEVQQSDITPLTVVEKNQALMLKALREFTDDVGDCVTTHCAGDQWLFKGPGTYIPRVEAQIIQTVHSSVIQHSQALRLRAKNATTDCHGVSRCDGEEWLVRETGAYMPSIEEEVIETVKGIVLTDQQALQLKALKTFTDVYNIERRAGEQWLVTNDMSDAHICDVYEEKMKEVQLITLSSRQYAVIEDPVIDGQPRLGAQQLRKGECSFFLKPGERLKNSETQSVIVLSDDEALLLQALEALDDEESSPCSEEDVVTVSQRMPGDRWMVYGPRDYIPPVEVEVLEKRQKIPLDENEGIYVRNINTGVVSAVIGNTYMLNPHEELWEKELPDEVEELLTAGSRSYVPASERERVEANWGEMELQQRDRTRVVNYQVPHNAACQVYDFKTKTSRVVFGPDLVMLSPDEQFTVLSLSGDKPKRPAVVRSLSLMLGPDFMTDIIVVETSDHARLRLQLAYNWHFMVPDEDKASIFNVRDFTGDCCKAIASRVRSAVAAESFDNFHKNSARVIRKSVFGEDDAGKIRKFFEFAANNLVVTNIDIQSAEPVDESTLASLQKSVQLAIQITTQSQEAKATHDAHREEEEAKGLLERQRLENEAKAEQERKRLLELKAECNAVESSGQATAEARARAEAAQIEGEAHVKQAELKAQAMRIEMEAKLECLRLEREAEATHREAMDRLEVNRAKQLSEIEAKKFHDTVDSIGQNTLVEMARAGPEAQAKLLGGLGLQGYLVTDGKSPINLMSTAQGLIGMPGAVPGANV